MSALFYFLPLVLFSFSMNLAAGEELLELGCLDDQQCKQFQRVEINVSCLNGHCHCSEAGSNGTTVTKIVKCIPQDLKVSNIVGGPCPCYLSQAECKADQNICYCAQGYVASADKRRCLPANVQLGQKCETDTQCHSSDFYAVCNDISKICECQTNFTLINGTCLSIANPAAVCHHNHDCRVFGLNVVCLKDSQKCVCSENYVKATNRTECLPLASYQENCIEDQQCVKNLGPGGLCLSGSCKCKDTHYFVQNQAPQNITKGKPQVMCTRTIEIGDYCYKDEDCFQLQLPSEEQTMSCIFGECNCKWGYYSINEMECMKGNHGSARLHIFWAFIVLAAVIALKL